MAEYIEQFWRPATSADVVDVMNGKEVQARFRDGDTGGWLTGKLRGVKVVRGISHWMTSGASWTHCQVYDPPQWFLDKPEPGEGFRLLGKSPDEAVQGGDFAFARSRGWIELNNGCDPAQGAGIWYRRKIEPKPEPSPSANAPGTPDSSWPAAKLASCLSQAMQNDQDLAWTWHCNIAVGSLDEGVDHKTANLAAARFMSVVFGVDVTAFDEWSRFDWAKKQPKPEPQHYTLAIGDTVETLNGLRLTVTEHGVEVQ